MNLQTAVLLKKGYLNKIGKTYNNGFKVGDLLIVPVNRIQESLECYARSRNVSLDPILVDSNNEYGIIAVDLDKLKRGVFIYEIVADMYEDGTIMVSPEFDAL